MLLLNLFCIMYTLNIPSGSLCLKKLVKRLSTWVLGSCGPIESLLKLTLCLGLVSSPQAMHKAVMIAATNCRTTSLDCASVWFVLLGERSAVFNRDFG